MKQWWVRLCLAAVFFGPVASAETGLVNLPVGGKTYFQYDPAAPGSATVVLLNGLTYSVKSWDAFVTALRRRSPGLGILRYDMIGMGETLLRNKIPVTDPVVFTSQVEQLKGLLDHFRLSRVVLAGLSYGGGIGVAFATRHPAYVQALVLMAPFTEPLKGMDNWIHEQVALNRLTFPLNPATDDELYDYYLREFIYAYYPALEPSVLENSFKLEAVFRMVQGIRHYDTLADSARLPAGTVHLVVAQKDQYIEKAVHDRFWQAVAPAARASRVDVSLSEHKIPESVPGFAAAWVLAVAKGRAELSGAREFLGDSRALTATSGGLRLDLNQL